MRNKFLKDLLIYCILPISGVLAFYSRFAGIGVSILIIGSIYTIYTKKIEDRINHTFASFLFIFTVYFIIKSNIEIHAISQYNIAFLLVLSIGLLVLETFDQNICRIILKDTLVFWNINKIKLYKLTKQNKIGKDLKKLSMTIIVQLLCCDFLAIYYINILKTKNTHYIVTYEILMSTVFILIELYQINLIKEKINCVKSSVKDNCKEGKVIDLQRYR